MSGVVLLLRRVLGIVAKEAVELRRQPGLMASLVVGPLLILLLFGSGVSADDPAARSIFVTPSGDPELAEVVADYAESQSERLTITAITPDEDDAIAALREGEVDVVVIFPDAPSEAVESGERATIRVVHRFIDPLEAQSIRLFTRGAVDDLNDILLELGIARTQEVAAEALQALGDAREALVEPVLSADVAPGGDGAGGDGTGGDGTGGDGTGGDGAGDDGAVLQERLDAAQVELADLIDVDPGVVAAPLEGEATSVGGAVTTSQFYAPAVVALILQHLTLTFVALARSRERELGTEELFAVSPLRPAERLAGQAIAYLLIGGALGAVLLTAVSLLLGAPLRGGIGPVALVVVLELLASIGLGLVLARVARSTTQVVQGAMLLLLLSVFFGGLLLSPERLLPWARPIGTVLPMFHALDLLRDSMLRGIPLDPVPLVALAAMAVVLLGLATWWARRDERHA